MLTAHMKDFSFLLAFLCLLHAINMNKAFPAASEQEQRPNKVRVVYSQSGANPPPPAAVRQPLEPAQQQVLDPNISQQPVSDFYSRFNNPPQYAQQILPPGDPQQQPPAMLPGFGGVGLLQNKLNNLLQYKANMWKNLPNMLPVNPVIDTPALVQKLTPDWSALNTRSPLYKMYGGHSPLGELLAVKADLIPQIVKTGFLVFVALKVLGVLGSVIKAKKALLIAKKKLKLTPLAILAAKNNVLKDDPPSSASDEDASQKKESKRERRSSASPVVEGEFNVENIMSQLESIVARFLQDH